MSLRVPSGFSVGSGINENIKVILQVCASHYFWIPAQTKE